MPIVAAGQSITFTVAAGDYIRVTTGPSGFATLEAAGSPGLASGERRWTRINGRQVFGPWQAGAVRINALADSVDYEFGAQIRSDDADRPAQWSDAGGTALVRPDGTAAEIGISGPLDVLTPPLQSVNLTGALSTTAVLSATATGTYRKARVVWNNNGASTSARVRVAVNADNDVHGLRICANAQRRDYEMGMGDGVILVCSVPITRLTFQSDTSITSGTHQLQVVFGN